MILDNLVLNKLFEIYNDCIRCAISGNDNEFNDLKLEVLYELRTEIWKEMRSKDENINKEIVNHWTILQVYKILIKMRETKCLELEDIDMFDEIANSIFLEVCNV